jgi:glucose-6-phosphate dehydrogenase assembly protein OpcA
VTAGAGAKVLFPGWFAVRLQVPAATRFNVVQLTVQTEAVVDVIVTGRPELALALSGGAGVPRV